MNLVLAPMASQSGSAIFERILASASALVVLETTDALELLGQFRVIARASGQSMYVWQPDSGLVSLRDPHGGIPDCRRLAKALRYIQQSLHFGIYFLVGLELPLSAIEDTLLRQLAQAPDVPLRRVVLMDAPGAWADALSDVATRLDGDDSRPQQLRLRDGHWVD